MIELTIGKETQIIGGNFLWIDTTKGEVTTLPIGLTYLTRGRAIFVQAHTFQTDEHCQYCGNSWQQTRTIGTPRLDAVPCPACKRLV